MNLIDACTNYFIDSYGKQIRKSPLLLTSNLKRGFFAPLKVNPVSYLDLLLTVNFSEQEKIEVQGQHYSVDFYQYRIILYRG